MKKAEADYLILCEINALVSALIGAVRKKSKNLEEQDISFFCEALQNIYENDFFPVLDQCRQDTGNAPSRAFPDKYDYLVRT